MLNYTQVKELARTRGCKVTDLIALAPQNDPFYCGTPTDLLIAGWFADLWNQFGYAQGIHIRRVHYQIISQTPPVSMPNGKPYENTETCWDFLNQASKMARYLNLVDPGAFVDRRNPEPRLFARTPEYGPSIEVHNFLWGTPRLPDFPSLPSYDVYNYEGTQRYHLEIWCEKSTMNDVLIPLCERYGINLVTGVGEMSITATLDLAKRFNSKPVRIFYISDFDPAGQSMPVAVSRKVEYFQREGGYEGDVRLYPLMLNVGQVLKYALPRTPIKETERRAAGFEDRYGSGAVELDALEALYPGTLSRIVTEAISPYFDANLAYEVRAAERTLRGQLSQVRNRVLAPHLVAISALQREYEQIVAEFDKRMESYGERITTLWAQIERELKDEMLDIADFPIPEASFASERSDPLYDSGREYVEQIASYKGFQGKN